MGRKWVWGGLEQWVEEGSAGKWRRINERITRRGVWGGLEQRVEERNAWKWRRINEKIL